MPTAKDTKARYAANTGVSVAQSRAEIERLLERYGATSFMYGNDVTAAAVAFEMKGRRIRFSLRLPALADFAVTQPNRQYPTGKVRAPAEQKKAYDQEIRRLWRALTMIIKAKLEAIENGVRTLEEEFLADTILPDNQTVSQWLEPQMEEVYRTGKVPPLIPGLALGNQKRIGNPDIIEGEFHER